MGLEESFSSLVLYFADVIDILLIIGILFLVIIILKIIEKGLRGRLSLRLSDRNLFYRREIKRLSKSKANPEKILEGLNNLARDFFKEAFDFSYHLEYSELIPKFKNLRKKECITFCKMISKLNYSGEEVKKEKLDVLMNLLRKIIEGNRILTDAEKIKLEEERRKEEIKAQKKKKVEETLAQYKQSLNFVAKIKAFWFNLRKKIEEIRLKRELRKYPVP